MKSKMLKKLDAKPYVLELKRDEIIIG
jgi:hypothetical protein